jgi:hypothetical protein
LILCGTAEFPGSLVYDNFRSGNPSITPTLLTALHHAGAAPQHDILVSGVQGNHYNAIGLLTDGSPFDVHIPGWSRPPADDVPLLPYRAAVEIMSEELREFDKFCERLKGLKYRRFVHLASPPPNPDQAFVRSKLPPLPTGEEPEISSADLRLKLWTIQTRLMEQIVSKYGGVLLQPPRDTRDADGFLAPQYWKDSVHANAAYHALQLEQIRAVMNELSVVAN